MFLDCGEKVLVTCARTLLLLVRDTVLPRRKERGNCAEQRRCSPRASRMDNPLELLIESRRFREGARLAGAHLQRARNASERPRTLSRRRRAVFERQDLGAEYVGEVRVGALGRCSHVGTPVAERRDRSHRVL